MTLSSSEVKAGVLRSHEEFADFIEGLTDEQWNAPSRCEGWTAGDVARHVVGGMADIAAGRLEGLGTPEVTAREVEERQGHSPSQVAQELRDALKANTQLLDMFDEAAWNGPAAGGYDGTLTQGVEAIWYDAIVHSDDIAAATGASFNPGTEDLRACVHHVAFELEKLGWGPATLALDGIEEVNVGGGGDRVTGDPIGFLRGATGRGDAIPGVPDIYAE